MYGAASPAFTKSASLAGSTRPRRPAFIRCAVSDPLLEVVQRLVDREGVVAVAHHLEAGLPDLRSGRDGEDTAERDLDVVEEVVHLPAVVALVQPSDPGEALVAHPVTAASWPQAPSISGRACPESGRDTRRLDARDELRVAPDRTPSRSTRASD